MKKLLGSMALAGLVAGWIAHSHAQAPEESAGPLSTPAFTGDSAGTYSTPAFGGESSGTLSTGAFGGSEQKKKKPGSGSDFSGLEGMAFTPRRPASGTRGATNAASARAAASTNAAGAITGSVLSQPGAGTTNQQGIGIVPGGQEAGTTGGTTSNAPAVGRLPTPGPVTPARP